MMQHELITKSTHVCHIHFKIPTTSINTRHSETRIHIDEYNFIFQMFFPWKITITKGLIYDDSI